MMFDWQALIKYLLEGLAVAVAAFLIPQKTMDPTAIVLIALTAAAVFAVLDAFSPSISVGARQGAGFGIGLNQIGWPGLAGGSEDLDNKIKCSCEVNPEELCPMHGPVPPGGPAYNENENASGGHGSRHEEMNENDDGVVQEGSGQIKAFDGYTRKF